MTPPDMAVKVLRDRWRYLLVRRVGALDSAIGGRLTARSRWRVRYLVLDLARPIHPASAEVAANAGVVMFGEETIEPDNAIFADCLTAWDVEDRYEAFWNRLNAETETAPPYTHNPAHRVKVIAVEEVR